MFFKSKRLNASPERARYDAGHRFQTDAIRAFGQMPADDIASPFYRYFNTEDGPMFDPYRIPGSRSLHDQKMATWALLIGETYSSAVHAQTRRRPHRGMLPDVDFSRAVPDPGRPSLVRRLIRLIRPKTRAVASVASASSNQPVGETSSTPYIGRSKTGDSGESEPPVLDAVRPLAA